VVTAAAPRLSRTDNYACDLAGGIRAFCLYVKTPKIACFMLRKLPEDTIGSQRLRRSADFTLESFRLEESRRDPDLDG
jgi:hypothetical protein